MLIFRSDTMGFSLVSYAFSTHIIVEIRGEDNKENRRLRAIVVRTEVKDDSLQSESSL